MNKKFTFSGIDYKDWALYYSVNVLKGTFCIKKLTYRYSSFKIF